MAEKSGVTVISFYHDPLHSQIKENINNFAIWGRKVAVSSNFYHIRHPTRRMSDKFNENYKNFSEQSQNFSVFGVNF